MGVWYPDLTVPVARCVPDRRATLASIPHNPATRSSVSSVLLKVSVKVRNFHLHENALQLSYEVKKKILTIA